MTLAGRMPLAVPAAIAPIATLPVFLDLRGKRALVVGGTAAAAWKAELLLAAGAGVAVIAAEPSPEMSGVLGRSGGRAALAAGPFAPQHLAGLAVAICDAGDDAEAAAFAALCRAAGVPHNVIDEPAHSAFSFGTIVNRSPVVIGIGTSGVAPVLGQAIRQRVEAILPRRLPEWAGLAARLRDRVLSLLPEGSARRRFWDAFVDRVFSADTVPGEGAYEAEADRWIGAAREKTRAGRVTLVGAGPGSAEFLTLRAVRALQTADVILFDDLVTDEVLELARREAVRIGVGKRGGLASCRQEDINDLLLEHARQGRHVVRLKSGDPMVFGRGGEEIAVLDRAGIAVEVVPGITAAMALASRLGVSLTHRDRAQSLRFVTGYAKDGALPRRLDWKGLADPATTLVVYMGGGTAPTLSRRLIQHGLDPATPVVVAENLSRDDEKIERLCLRDLARGLTSGSGPVLVGIGSVFARAESAAIDIDEAVGIPA
ncbi:MAG: uroporphyrinogen-III C-methyltransferase [Bauldia sp.]|nr:uroporphyrinogen-III C-methyltransferase [Bauldia sp.]